MPIYEYLCAGCGHAFEALVYGSERPRCPECEGVELEKQLSAVRLRVSGDYRAEKLGAKIRDAQLELIPYMMVVGPRDADAAIDASVARACARPVLPDLLRLSEPDRRRLNRRCSGGAWQFEHHRRRTG